MADDNNKITFTDEPTSGGRGTWFLGRFLFWGMTPSAALILLDRSRDKLHKIFSFFAWLIIFSGWAALGWWLFINLEAVLANPLGLLFVWRRFDPLILYFLLSLWADLFLFYRWGLKRAARKKINYRLFNQEKLLRSSSKTYDISRAYSDEARRAIDDAYLLAVKLKQKEAGVLHLFRVLLRTKEIQALFIRLDAKAKRLVEMLDRHLFDIASKNKDASSGRGLSPALEEVLVLAFLDAYQLTQDSVDVLNLILFCADKDELLKEMLYELEIDEDKIRNTVAWFRVNRQLVENYRRYRQLAILKPSNNMNRSYTAIATPNLDRFSHDLTVRAKYGGLDVCVGREREINSIFEAFTGGHNGVLLVGRPGTGKSNIIGGLAQLMVEEKVPSFLKDKRLVEIDVPLLVSGVSPAEASERLLISIYEASRSGNIILYFDNLENLLGISTGSQESLDLSEVLAEAIGRKNVYCLAAATTENYARYIENKAIGSLMTTVGIHEPDTNTAIRMLETKVGFLEAKYDIYIVYSALEQAVVMSDRYLHDKALPLKAFNLLEKAVIMAAKEAKSDVGGTAFCGREQVAAAISELTGIPVSKVSASESERLLNLETEIHKRLIDQVEAVEAVSASLRRARVELKDRRRPIASFLFLGPTGVGKTELAKSVSEVYFGDEDYLIRLDMSEYQSTDSVRKMIGDVDGTLGYLTEAVRKKPFSLILFDEIEKANPDILNLFLQLLDDGRLTDGQGRTISFSESIIIATSNIGAVYIQDQIKTAVPLNIIKQELIDNQLNQYLRPELINRFDGIIVFRPLSEEDIFAITGLMLKKLKKNLGLKGINLKADKDGVAALAKAGYDPKFGARPLRRLLQEKIENDIANRILAGEITRRDTIIINRRAKIEVEKAVKL